MYVAKMVDTNGSTFYTTLGGSLSRNRDDAERFFTREMAELYADPSFNGIPASRIRALDIRGYAVKVTAESPTRCEACEKWMDGPALAPNTCTTHR